MIVTNNYNIEIEEGAPFTTTFYCMDDSTGLPVNITGSLVEMYIKFDDLNDPILFTTITSPYITIVGVKGSVTVAMPWLSIFNIDNGNATYSLYVTLIDGTRYLLSKGMYTIIRNAYQSNTTGTSGGSGGDTTQPRSGIKKVTSDYSLTLLDSTILVDATDGPIDLTLLDLGSSYLSGSGKIFSIKRIDSTDNDLTLVGTVDGVINPVLNGANSTIQLQAYADGYYSISYSNYISQIPDPAPQTVTYSYIAAIF